MTVRAATTRQLVRRIPYPRQVRDVELEVLDFIEPTNDQMTFRLEPRDRLAVRVCPWLSELPGCPSLPAGNAGRC